ncbi:MAG TPA: DinB family protein, partial [Ktedonobacterales bacterium]
MDRLWRTVLWKQFGATIDMLENALIACPSAQWAGHLWSDPSGQPQPSRFDAFWSLTHHTLFWLDFYLTGSLEGFTPPTPFTVDEEGAPERIPPDQPYTREELHAYLVQLRQKCQTTLHSLSDEQAHRQVVFPWLGEEPMSFLELQLHSMRHVQEHAAQLSLFLGQHGIPDEALDWVPRAKDD